MNETIGNGERVEALMSNHLSYTIENRGSELNVKASRGQIYISNNADGSLTIRNSEPARRDEVCPTST